MGWGLYSCAGNLLTFVSFCNKTRGCGLSAVQVIVRKNTVSNKLLLLHVLNKSFFHKKKYGKNICISLFRGFDRTTRTTPRSAPDIILGCHGTKSVHYGSGLQTV